MSTKTYQVIEEAPVYNLNKEVVKKLSSGQEVTGELVMVSEEPYIETADELYVSTKYLAEKLDDSDYKEVSSKVKSSPKKLYYAIGGGILGFGVAHFLKMDMKKKIMFTVGGLMLGLVAEYVQNRKASV